MRVFFVLLFLLLVSSFGFAHGSHGESNFESPFFIIVFGGIGVGIYASFVENRLEGLRFFELLGSFFLGYYLFSFIFNLLFKFALG
ncbi:MAG: hypothetical protein QXZ13_02315 [Candidatus Diapherotrites archaeon]